MKKRLNGEGSIYKRKDGRWCASYFDSEYKRHYVYGKTQKQAKEKLKEKMKQEQSHSQGKDNEENLPLQEWVYKYLETYKKNSLKESTYGSYMLTYRKHILGSDIGVKNLSVLTVEDLQKYYNGKISEGYNSKTVRHIALLVSGALNMAVRLHYISENVALYVVIPKKKKYETSPLSMDNIQKIVNEAKEEKIYPIVLLGLLCGMRKGEIMGLRWDDVSFDKRQIHVRCSLCKIMDTHPNEEGHYITHYKLMEPKNKTSIRTIPMADAVYDALLRHKKMQEMEKQTFKDIYNDQGLVFAEADGSFLKQRQFNDHYHDLLLRYGIPQVRFHDLRHSFASMLLHEQVSIRTIQDLMGHASITTSMDIYGHIANDMKEEAVSRLKF